MCITKENLVNKEKVTDTNSSNWRQLFRKPLKPRLTRKIVTSAKMNINRCWNKFEELLSSDTSNRSTIPSSDSYTVRLLPIVKMSSKVKSEESSDNPLTSVFRRNNIQDEINSFMAKRFTIEKNFARSSMYKHFNDDQLYHGVNLNVPRQRCSCSDIPLVIPSKYQFTHRNIQISSEDKENLENEAMEVFSNLGYDTSF